MLALPSDQVLWQCRSPRICPGSTRAGGSPANGCSRSSGGHQGRPSAAIHADLVGRVGQRLERGDVCGRARRADQLGPVALGLDGHQLDRHPLDGQPDRPALAALEQRDDLRQLGKAREHGTRLRRDADDRQQLGGVAPAAHVARGGAAERLRDAADELQRAIQQQSLSRPRLALARERLEQPRLGLGADPRHRPQPALGRGVAQLGRGPHAQRAGELDTALGAEPEIAAETDEIGSELALELLELGDLARLDELAQPRLDPGADSAQPPHVAPAHELGDGQRRLPDRLGRAPVRAGRVRVRLGQLQQRSHRVQAVGDLAVVHGGSFPARVDPGAAVVAWSAASALAATPSTRPRRLAP